MVLGYSWVIGQGQLGIHGAGYVGILGDDDGDVATWDCLGLLGIVDWRCLG